MRNRLVSSGMAEKDLTEKSGFDFTGRAVLTEELGAGAGHHEKRNRLLSSDRQKRSRLQSPVLTFQADPFWPRS